jgi:hypothetical protein
MMLLDSLPRSRKLDTGYLPTLMDLLGDLISAGGPKPEDYAELNRSIRKVGDDIRGGVVTEELVGRLLAEVTEKHFEGTLQHAARSKPHGYSGDFLHFQLSVPEETITRHQRFLNILFHYY